MHIQIKLRFRLNNIFSWLLTCIGFQVFRCDHHHKANDSLITEHFIGPASNWTHAFNGSNAIISNQYLRWERYSKKIFTVVNEVKQYTHKGMTLTLSIMRFPPKRVTNSAGEATVKSLCTSIFLCSLPFFSRWGPDMLGLQAKKTSF